MKTTELFSSTYKDKARALICTPHSGQRPTDEVIEVVALLLSKIDWLKGSPLDMSFLGCDCAKCEGGK